MAHSRLTVSVDSGPAHMAAAMGDRLLAIHSWSNPLKVGPYRRRAWVWKGGEMAQVADLDPDFASRSGGMPSAKEIESIAGRVGKLLEESG